MLLLRGRYYLVCFKLRTAKQRVHSQLGLCTIGVPRILRWRGLRDGEVWGTEVPSGVQG